MKKAFFALLALALLLPAAALGDGPVLLVHLPQDAQMVENIAFDDGDFIQTYQLSGGANVQLLRYQAFDMTIDDLVASEWTGCLRLRRARGQHHWNGCDCGSRPWALPIRRDRSSAGKPFRRRIQRRLRSCELH